MSLKEYQIISKLGSGSFGIVYKARQKSTSLTCVIKQVQLSKLDTRLRKWAMNQASIMKSINSPYIVKYFTSFTQNQKLFIIMQHCPKGDLSKYLKSQLGKPLKQQTIWKFTIQILIGLRDLHIKKILHRDIKTLNIFLDQKQNVRVGDLGVAKMIERDFTQTVVGTPYYLSPEMCEEKPYNQKTDIWAVGCLIYQLCTGKHPFQAQNQAALALKIVMGRYKDIPSNYSEDLRLIIQNCLSVDYKRRPGANMLLQRKRVIEESKKQGIQINHNQNYVNKSLNQKNIKQEKKTQINKVNNLNKQEQKIIKNNQKPPLNQQNSKLQKKKSVQKVIKTSQQKKVNHINLKQMKKVDLTNQQQKKDLQSAKDKQEKVVKYSKQKPKVGQIPSNQPPKAIIPSSPKVPTKSINPILDKKPSLSSNVLKQVKKQVPIIAKQSRIQQKLPSKNIQQYQSVKSSFQSTQQRLNQQRQKQRLLLQREQQTLQNFSKRRQFNQQDRKQLKMNQKAMIKQLNSFESKTIQHQNQHQNKLQNKFQFQQQQKQLNKKIKQTQFVKSKIQSQINDDQLMAEFGITPQKVNTMNNNINMKNNVNKNIKWDVQQNQEKQQKKQQKKQKVTMYKQLPTIKSNSNSQQIKDMTKVYTQTNDQTQQNDGIFELQQDNRPFDQQQHQQIQHNLQAQQQQQDQRYLIQNIQAQFQSQALKSLQNSIQLYSKRLFQNKKRLQQLQSLKTHTQKQYFSHLKPNEYKRIKMQINLLNEKSNQQQQNNQNNQNYDKQIDRLIRELVKGKQNLVMKFLKIMGYQMQIEICEKNIKQCDKKIKEIRLKIQKNQLL